MKTLPYCLLAFVLIACGSSEDTDTGSNTETDAVSPAEGPEQTSQKDPLHVYMLDCGRIEISDLDGFSDAGDYAGLSEVYASTCWLVRHPEGDLLWDLGLPSQLVGAGEQESDVFTLSMDRTLTEQMQDFGYAPWDLDFVSISHSHFDHTGQIDQFPDATWLVHENEYTAMFPTDAAPLENDPDIDGEVVEPFAEFSSLERKTFSGSYDVFGDGSVTILSMPGHTPGHTALQLMLPQTGPVLLTGDLYHRRESRDLRRIPRFNSDAGQTRASMDAFEAVAAELGAKVIIQHSLADTESLPKPPDALR